MTPILHATMAKVLLFIALTVGPANPTCVYATSHNESYVWTPQPYGWHLDALGFPASDFSRNPTVDGEFSGGPHKGDVPSYIRDLGSYDWSRKNAVVVFENGNRVEKHGDHVFFIVNAGGPNEKDFTIFFKTE